LYESSGFKITGVREKYYNNTEDAVLMEKKINVQNK
jgi:ribosomal protein S18 acetylase RimI-like enzyme